MSLDVNRIQDEFNDWLAVSLAHMQMSIDHLDIDNDSITISFLVNLYEYLIYKKFGRKMRALQYFLKDIKNRDHLVCFGDTITSVKMPNQVPKYAFKIADDHLPELLFDDISAMSRDADHQQLLESQLNDLLDALLADISRIGNDIMKWIEKENQK